MAFRNDGSFFSKFPGTQMMAEKKGSASVEDLNRDDEMLTSLIDGLANGGVMGTTGKVAGVAAKRAFPQIEQAIAKVEPGMADRIKQAVANTKVKVIPTADQAVEEQVKNQFKDAPKNFFDKYGRDKANEKLAQELKEQQLNQVREEIKRRIQMKTGGGQ